LKGDRNIDLRLFCVSSSFIGVGPTDDDDDDGASEVEEEDVDGVAPDV